MKSEIIRRQFESLSDEAEKFLPVRRTDVSLEDDERKIIIDAKFYRAAMTENYSREKIKSANLYQLFSYLLNQRAAHEKTPAAAGILLYPTVERDYDSDFRFENRPISIKTVNPNTNRKNIARRL
ncbi:MAG TPA: hypothetical protein VF604_14760 [Pyrinomonadaceae bacterium]